MALRNRSTLKRCSEGVAEKPDNARSTQRAKRRAALNRVAVKLVSSDPALAQFLQPDLLSSSDPKSSNAAREVASAKVERAVSSLGKLEAEVIEALFPTSGAAPESFDSLASRLGMTVEQVKGVADNALRDLRGSRRSGLRLSPVWN